MFVFFSFSASCYWFCWFCCLNNCGFSTEFIDVHSTWQNLNLNLFETGPSLIGPQAASAISALRFGRWLIRQHQRGPCTKSTGSFCSQNRCEHQLNYCEVFEGFTIPSHLILALRSLVPNGPWSQPLPWTCSLFENLLLGEKEHEKYFHFWASHGPL